MWRGLAPEHRGAQSWPAAILKLMPAMNDRRRFLCTSLALGAATSSQALSAAPARPVVRLGIGDWAPFFSADLPGQGLFAQIVSLAFERAGYAVHYEQMPWRRALADMEQGLLDGSPGWAFTEERAAKFLYSDPVLMSRDALFFLKARPLEFQTDEQIQGSLLGATAGYFYGPLIQQYEAQNLIRLDRAPNDEASLRKLLLGRVDAVLMNRETGLHLLATRLSAEERAQFDVARRFISAKTSHLLMSRARPGVTGLLGAFNQGLAALHRAGEIQRILGDLPATRLPRR